MNKEMTDSKRVYVRVVGYSDGVWNLELHRPEAPTTSKIDIARRDAEEVCGLLEDDVPEPTATGPEEWK